MEAILLISIDDTMRGAYTVIRNVCINLSS